MKTLHQRTEIITGRCDGGGGGGCQNLIGWELSKSEMIGRRGVSKTETMGGGAELARKDRFYISYLLLCFKTSAVNSSVPFSLI